MLTSILLTVVLGTSACQGGSCGGGRQGLFRGGRHCRVQAQPCQVACAPTVVSGCASGTCGTVVAPTVVTTSAPVYAAPMQTYTYPTAFAVGRSSCPNCR